MATPAPVVAAAVAFLNAAQDAHEVAERERPGAGV